MHYHQIFSNALKQQNKYRWNKDEIVFRSAAYIYWKMHVGCPVYLYVNIVQRTKLVYRSIFFNIKMQQGSSVGLIFMKEIV